MRIKTMIVPVLVMAMGCILLVSAPDTYAARQINPQNKVNVTPRGDDRHAAALQEEVRHQLVMLPYYSVFDWLQAEVQPDGAVTLMGEVTRPTTKDDAEHRLKGLEGLTRLTNKVEVLPLSPMDDQLRLALYRAIFSYNSPLFRYATQSVPPIHIIVKNGNVTLKGIVADQGDSDLAYIKASQVPNIFNVKNELQVEGKTDERIS